MQFRHDEQSDSAEFLENFLDKIGFNFKLLEISSESEIICLHCGKKKSKILIQNFINLPLPETKSLLNLNDLLYSHLEIRTLMTDYKCSCEKKLIENIETIKCLPELLIVNTSRKKDLSNYKISSALEIPKEIEIMNSKYELISISFHKGETIEEGKKKVLYFFGYLINYFTGHYYNYLNLFGSWYYTNDKVVEFLKPPPSIISHNSQTMIYKKRESFYSPPSKKISLVTSNFFFNN
jgi:ubiquitin C-terminal hydrolase